MGQVFAAFGIDWRLLLINVINFGILLLALWYFLYGPLTRMLETRRQKLAEGIHNADEAARRLAEIENSRKEELARAAKEADGLLSRARASGAAKERELVAAAEAAAANILEEAEKEAKELQSQALAHSKQEAAKLVVLGMEKLMAAQKK